MPQIACNVGIMGTYGASVIPAVFVLHSCGFFLGYYASKALGTTDKVARTNSIEVILLIYQSNSSPC